MGSAAISADPDRHALGPPDRKPNRIPAAAGEAYGRVLAHLDSRTLALWTLGAGPRVPFFRWYVRLFGFPELAAHRRFRQIQEQLGRAGSVVLDLGAGAGLYSLADAIRRPESSHVLVDVSRRHMHRATVTGRSLGLDTGGVVSSAEAVPLAAASVDAVLLIEVLQFIDDDVRVVREIGRVLRPGGVWVCEQEQMPDDAPLKTAEQRERNEDRLTKRRAGYSAARLRDLAARNGLALESSGVVSGRISRWWEGLGARVLGRSRALHMMLFPLGRFLSALTRVLPPEAEPGTVLYVFRKHGPARPR
jgi:SAM-dependent methyltransferase